MKTLFVVVVGLALIASAHGQSVPRVVEETCLSGDVGRFGCGAPGDVVRSGEHGPPRNPASTQAEERDCAGGVAAACGGADTVLVVPVLDGEGLEIASAACEQFSRSLGDEVPPLSQLPAVGSDPETVAEVDACMDLAARAMRAALIQAVDTHRESRLQGTVD